MSAGRIERRAVAAAPPQRGATARFDEERSGEAGRRAAARRDRRPGADAADASVRRHTATTASLGGLGGPLPRRRRPRAREVGARLRQLARVLPAVRSARLTFVLLLISSSPLAAAQPIPGGRGDVLVRRDCRSTIAREEVTLFGNGTVRLRSGPLGEERMVLGEVSRDEVESLVAALRREDLREAGAGAAGPEGDWVERCVLELPVLAAGGAGGGAGDAGAAAGAEGRPGGGEVAGSATGVERRSAGARDGTFDDDSLGPGRPSGGGAAPTRFLYGHLDSLALPLARVVALVDDLAVRVAAGAAAGGLPSGYRPRAGDVLRRIDGVLFRVVRATADLEGMPRGWELQGVVQPLAVYVVESDLGREFVELVSREGGDAP